MSAPERTPPASGRDTDALLGDEGQDTIDGNARRDDEAPAAELRRRTVGSLKHLSLAVVVLCVLGAVPYSAEALRPYRAWVSGEGVPIARMFLGSAPTEAGMAVATGGAVSRATGSEARIADALGEAVAQNLEDDDGAASPPAAEDGPEPAGEPTEGQLTQRPSSVTITDAELEGLARELEDPGGRAMRPFYEALEQTARREGGAITRVAHYGDSSIAGDGITSTLRRRFQQRFGDAGHGFVLIARGSMPYRHQDIDHDASGEWRLIELVRAGLRDHLYGFGGVQYRAGPGARARFGTSDRGPVGGAVSRYELWYQAHPRGGRVNLRVDRGEPEEFDTEAPEVGDGWHTVSVPDGEHRLELRAAGGGEVRLYGMVLEREGPGVVYDSLGMVGARARRMLGIDPAHFARQHAHRQTNLIVLGFGGNDADDSRTPAQFEEDFRQVARLARTARPEAACLLMAPLDQARRDERGAIQTIEQVPIIVEAQRRAALAEGCAFFDTYSAMGGEGAMRAWFRTNPRLAFGDFRHATPAGYRVIGNMLYRAILKGFRDHLRAAEGPPRTQP